MPGVARAGRDESSVMVTRRMALDGGQLADAVSGRAGRSRRA